MKASVLCGPGAARNAGTLISVYVTNERVGWIWDRGIGLDEILQNKKVPILIKISGLSPKG